MPDRIEQNVDDYGFSEITVTTKDGGRVKITYFGGFSDIGSFLISNGGGLGGSDYIRSLEDIPRAEQAIRGITWIEVGSKDVLVRFLQHLNKAAIASIKLLSAFNVTQSYVQGGVAYLYTRKENPRSSLSFTITVPSGWNESAAWSEAMRTLNPELARIPKLRL